VTVTSSSWAAQVLRAQWMPADEIEAVLEADTAEQVHHVLELHGERLRERLFDDLRALERVERLLTADVGAGSERRALSTAASR
jgi:hypothetical protein